MSREMRLKIREMRRSGMSIPEIHKLTNVSKSSISLWVRDIVLTPEHVEKLKERQRRAGGQHGGAQTNRRKALAQRVLYQEAGRLRAREGRPLHMMGCLLYWAEGAKRRNAVGFVNSDVNMMRLFARFLREEIHVPNEKMKVFINTHASDPIEIKRIEDFWLDLLQLPASRLGKTHTKKSSAIVHGHLTNGVCGLWVYSTEVLQHIFGAIQEYGGFDEPAWLG